MPCPCNNNGSTEKVKENIKVKCPYNSCNDKRPKVQVLCCGQTEEKCIFNINSDFHKLKPYGNASLTKCVELCETIYKLTYQKCDKKGKDKKEQKKEETPGVLLCLDSNACETNKCYKLELNGSNSCGSVAYLSINNSKNVTKIPVNSPFNLSIPFTNNNNDKITVNIYFQSNRYNSELTITKYKICDSNDCCKKSCKPKKCCTSGIEELVEEVEELVEEVEEVEDAGTCCKNRVKAVKNKGCTSCIDDRFPNLCCGKQNCTCTGPDKCLSTLCANSNCKIQLSTTAIINWNGNSDLSEIIINGKKLNLTKIGNHDGFFTLDDVVNHNGDQQLALLITKTLKLKACSVKVKTIIKRDLNQVLTPHTTIECLPINSVITAKSGTVVNPPVNQPIVTSVNINAATKYNTEQILPFLGINIKGTWTDGDLINFDFNFETALTMEDLADVMNTAAPVTSLFFFSNCGNDCLPGSIFSLSPGILTIGDTKIVNTKQVVNPMKQAQVCFNKIFGVEAIGAAFV